MGQTTLSKVKYALAALLYVLPLPTVLAFRGLAFINVAQLAGVFLALCFVPQLTQNSKARTALPVVMMLVTAALTVGVSATSGVAVTAWFVCAGFAHAWTLRSISNANYNVGPGLVALATLPAVVFVLPQSLSYPATFVSYITVGFVLNSASKYFGKPLLPSCEDVAAAIEPCDVQGVKVSVVLPSYNAGANLLKTVEGVHKALKNVRHEVIVVNDGSTDSSCLFDPAAHDVRLLNKSNGGKGTAVAVGVLSAAGEWVAFLDADGDISPSHLEQFLRLAESTGAHGVVGSKKAAGSYTATAWYRRLFSFGFQTLQRTLLSTGVQDSQVGCKLIKRECFVSAVRNSREREFLLDLELLSYMRRRKLVVLESPIQIESQGPSTVSPGTVLKMFSGVLALCAARVRGSGAELHETHTTVLDDSFGAQHTH